MGKSYNDKNRERRQTEWGKRKPRDDEKRGGNRSDKKRELMERYSNERN